jgi:hypothetical protein
MSVEEDNVATFKQYVAALPEQDPTLLREKLAAAVAHDFEGTDLPEPLRKQGREGRLSSARANKGGQAGGTVVFDDIIATSDKVVARMTGTFTPAGASEPFSFQLIEIAEIKTDGADIGKIARRWVEFDRTKVLQLLGMSPARRA